LTTSLKTSI